MTDPWYATAALIGSNVVFLPVLFIIHHMSSAFVLAPFFLAMLSTTLFVSPLYHLCASTNVCLLGMSPLAWRQLDWIFAVGQTEVLVVVAVTDGIEATPRGDKWALYACFMLLNTTVLYVLSRMTSFNQPLDIKLGLLVIITAAAAAIIKIVIINGGRARLFVKFKNWSLLIGALLLASGLVCFILELGEFDWFLHSLWHIFAAAAEGFILFGIGYNMKRLYAGLYERGGAKESAV